VLETVESFWKLLSKDRLPELKDFGLKLVLETHTCVRVRTFSTTK